jgi:acetyl esterase/lipase
MNSSRTRRACRVARFRLVTWLLAIAASLLAPTMAFAQAPTHRAIPYAQVGGRELLADLYVPSTGTPPYPLVVWLHDGGWLSGTRALPSMVLPLLAQGVAVATIDYRLTSEAGRYGAEGVTFPAQIHDVKGAIRYLRANASTYGFDPARIGVWGSSSGGHLAALAATSGDVGALEGDVGGNPGVSSRVQAAVDYYGPIDLLQLSVDVTTPPGAAFDHDAPGSPGSLLIGYSLPGQGLGVLRSHAGDATTPYPLFVSLARAASPLTYVDANDPPFLIAHGTADPQVAFHQSERLRDALVAVGASPQFVAVSGAGHGQFPASVQQQVIGFLTATLRATSVPIGNPRAIAGAWYEPATSGQGLEVQWGAGDTLLVFFFGHRDDGNNLFLLGVRTGALRYGEAMTMDLVTARGGRFNGLDPAAIQRSLWGTLTLTILDCGHMRAVMSGTDGNQTLQLERVLAAPAPLCD